MSKKPAIFNKKFGGHWDLEEEDYDWLMNEVKKGKIKWYTFRVDKWAEECEDYKNAYKRRKYILYENDLFITHPDFDNVYLKVYRGTGSGVIDAIPV